MNHPIRLKTIAPPLLIILALLCFGLSPTAKALLPAPSPDGGYPGSNTAEGNNALHDVNTAVGINNTAVGANALTQNTTGAYNVAVGSGALQSNTTGQQNMAIGTQALTNNNANFNLAIGYRVLFMNTTGSRLTGIGAAALRNNTTASDNTAIGSTALRENTTGFNNTAVGAAALLNNTEGDNNTATGAFALQNNTTGIHNTVVGSFALSSNIDGNFNTVVGWGALQNNTTGTNNTAVGWSALVNNTDGGFNAAFGNQTFTNLTSGSGNVAIGAGAGTDLTTGDGNIYIGNPGVTTETATIRIGVPEHGAAFIGGISGTAVVGDTVMVDANGQLGTATSSARFKKEIKPMDKTSEAILAFKPVSFQYKSDSKGTRQFGLIAEEVAKVNPDLVVRDRKGEIYSVRYDAVNAMLLNEFIKEHSTVQELKKEVAALTATVKEQASQIQQVSAQLAAAGPSRGGLEASKFATGRIRSGGPAPQVVNNP